MLGRAARREIEYWAVSWPTVQTTDSEALSEAELQSHTHSVAATGRSSVYLRNKLAATPSVSSVGLMHSGTRSPVPHLGYWLFADRRQMHSGKLSPH